MRKLKPTLIEKILVNIYTPAATFIYRNDPVAAYMHVPELLEGPRHSYFSDFIYLWRKNISQYTTLINVQTINKGKLPQDFIEVLSEHPCGKQMLRVAEGRARLSKGLS